MVYFTFRTKYSYRPSNLNTYLRVDIKYRYSLMLENVFFKIRYCCQHHIADHVFFYVTEIGNILMFHDKT